MTITSSLRFLYFSGDLAYCVPSSQPTLPLRDERPYFCQLLLKYNKKLNLNIVMLIMSTLKVPFFHCFY